MTNSHDAMINLAAQLWKEHGRANVSALVAELAEGAGDGDDSAEGTVLAGVAWAAAAMRAPVPNWGDAAYSSGAEVYRDADGTFYWARSGLPDDDEQISDGGFATREAAAQNACEYFKITPGAREVRQHWVVSDWLAAALEDWGERIARDLAGLTIWCRTADGPEVAGDGVIYAIACRAAREAA